MKPHEERLAEELMGLRVKIEMLEAFMKTVEFDALTILEKNLMHNQLAPMKQYSEFLVLRIDVAKIRAEGSST